MDDNALRIDAFIPQWATSPFCDFTSIPWIATSNAEELVKHAFDALTNDYDLVENVAIHRSARIETTAIVKGPTIIGPYAVVAANAYLRGGVYLDRDCSVGPSCELKSTFLFAGSKVAHLSFVGDSIVGSRVNIEAGAVVANHRNERSDKQIRIVWQGDIITTGVEKFGAIIGNDARIGANAVISPGCLLASGQIVPRLGLVDQDPASHR